MLLPSNQILPTCGRKRYTFSAMFNLYALLLSRYWLHVLQNLYLDSLNSTWYDYDNSHILELFLNNNYIFETSKCYFTSKVTTIYSIIFAIMCSQYRFLRTNNFREMIIISDIQKYNIIIMFGNIFHRSINELIHDRFFFKLNK